MQKTDYMHKDNTVHMTKRALISGITGQDGSYLAEFLLSKGYEVVGISRRSSTTQIEKIKHIQSKIKLESADLLDQASIESIFEKYKPDEVYNLAGQSFVGLSWEKPLLDAETTGLGVVRMLEAFRKYCHESRFYQATSSEIFGNVIEVPQSETTPLNPRNPYGLSKMYGHIMTKLYRDRYNLFVCSGILYNHESSRRGLEFVPRKITYGAAMIKLGLSNDLRLGNLDSKRDWGYAGDYVKAMWRMLQLEEPEDFIIASGQTHSVRDICRVAFEYLDLDYAEYVRIDPRFYRPAEEKLLIGNAAKAKKILNWAPEMSFEDLIISMVEADLSRLS